MSQKLQTIGKVKVTLKQAVGLVLPYIRKRIVEQLKSVSLIILYLIVFQTLVLGIAIAQALVIALGLALVIVGLTFFMEGLFLGIMPLGEAIGVKLPQKSKKPIILIFSFILGISVTLAEPAIGVLKAAGYSVKAWNAPLLFLLLNKYSFLLVLAVGTGVGFAVLVGMLRFLYNWSLKPLLYVAVPLTLVLSIWAVFEPNMIYLTGVAWDCGGVTTGPVTVPIVLALGIGVCRVVGSAGSSIAGFGVVTLASLFPIITVMSLGFPFLSTVPKPMNESEFFGTGNRDKVAMLFTGKENMIGYAFQNASEKGHLALFDNSETAMLDYLRDVAASPAKQAAVFGSAQAMQQWAALSGSKQQKTAVFGNEQAVSEAVSRFLAAGTTNAVDFADVLMRNLLAAGQAIIPLMLFLFLVLILVCREKLNRADEVVLGVALALVGMGFFNIGIELGLAKIGNQVGGKLPSSFKAIALSEERKTLHGFDSAAVYTAVTPSGDRQKFFFTSDNGKYKALPFDSSQYDRTLGVYTYMPTKGPIFGTVGGILVVLLFAFLMGYGATLAEPALNALGLTVEELSVGTFKKSLLMNTVATGVGIGMLFGVAKIIWDVSLIWLLIPPYAIVLLLTWFSTEEFVNIGWDSAGVTTGPITVPLVLAMGLGVSGQMGVVEGFGILAMASVWPILCVLLVGLIVTNSRKSALNETAQTPAEGAKT